jgi:protein ImuB
MAFAAIHIPDFMVQAVMRAESGLHGAAIALVDGKPPLWSVAAANAAALRAGIEMGMARQLAEQFEAVQIRSRSAAHEKAAHAALLDLGWSFSPRVEDTAADTIVVDLTGLSSLFGSDENIAAQLAQSVSAFGLAAHVAIASNIEVAIHAARGFPGITLIAPGEESRRLGSLPVGVFNPSAEILETLELWGVRTCEALAALPVLQLSERLGQEGVRLHEWARGAHVRSLVLAEVATCFEEEMELEDSVEELEPLSFLLGRLLDQLCSRLTARSLAARAIHVRFDLDPCGRKDLQIHNDDSRRKKQSSTFEKTLTLPVPMRNSKMLLSLLRLQLQGDPPAAPIQKIFMAAEPAPPRAVQTGLFLPASPNVEKLELIVARLGNLVGASNIGSPELVDTHRPGEFRMDRFAPSQEAPKTRRRKKTPALATATREENQPAPPDSPEIAKPAIGFRMFRPPLPANVQLQRSRPRSVVLRGTRGEVIVASGPWRTSGDWWRDDTWHEDEWDLEIKFHISESFSGKSPASAPEHGLYRFYFDSVRQKWFVRGIYD